MQRSVKKSRTDSNLFIHPIITYGVPFSAKDINKPRSLASGTEIWSTCVEKCWTVVVEVGLEKYGKTSQ